MTQAAAAVHDSSTVPAHQGSTGSVVVFGSIAIDIIAETDVLPEVTQPLHLPLASQARLMGLSRARQCNGNQEARKTLVEPGRRYGRQRAAATTADETAAGAQVGRAPTKPSPLAFLGCTPA
jgi:hypothetical protein